MNGSIEVEIPSWICDHYGLPTLRFRDTSGARGVFGPIEGHCHAEGIIR
ncbi:hypothetical protein GS429_08365 [Natronorubrum sp. JWXQ-INN-674]|uniref:Uncharacterized protein n=1 Tax=Natronorubrum halalkaliphilum TaxID=2691917 RepID=A0A6B0VLJ5_9EURY|nr:hypothetical protein [Natronorubrum halalkaliphilum]MXV62073.1 hypothetical protein [Natronorubrum halalkaliphilum]